MLTLGPVTRERLHDAFLEAFADYAMDTSGTTEEGLLLRMKKNAVDYDLSVGAYNGPEMVGFTLIGVDRWNGAVTAYDAGTGIVPAFRGQGLAHRMFDHALPTLSARGVKQFALEVLQGNEPAIKAYQTSGFDIRRTLTSYVGSTQTLNALPESGWTIRRADRATFDRFVAQADWEPSFENRFTIPALIPEQVMILAAFDGIEPIGVVTYSPPLHWLLSLIVRRTHRRRGVGTALLRSLAGELREDRPKLAAINIDGSDRGMQLFFTDLGFSHLIDQYEMLREIGQDDPAHRR